MLALNEAPRNKSPGSFIYHCHPIQRWQNFGKTYQMPQSGIASGVPNCIACILLSEIIRDLDLSAVIWNIDYRMESYWVGILDAVFR